MYALTAEAADTPDPEEDKTDPDEKKVTGEASTVKVSADER